MTIRITVDVENLSGSVTDTSFIAPLNPIIDLLETHQIKATFFIVGSLASAWQSQIQKLSENGHEIGLHGFTHQHLSALGPKKFKEELYEGKNLLGDVACTNIVGYRAPYFSLTKKASWASEILSELGFKFSSSVLPALNPQSGFPGAPRHPFLWESGLVEFPVPTFGFGKIRAPLLGGAYLRLIPKPVFVVAKHFGARRDGEWSYCHPYDFDVDAKFERIRDSSWMFSKLLFAKRRIMYEREKQLIALGQEKSFEEMIRDVNFCSRLQTFKP